VVPLLAIAAMVACGGQDGPETGATLPAPSAEAALPPTPPSAASQELMRKSIELYRRGDFKSAFDAASKALTASPGATDTYRLVSKIFTDIGRDKQGIDYFRKVAEKESRRWQPFFYQGLHEYHLHMWEESLTSFERATALDPGNAEAHARSGFLLEYMGDFDRAEDSFRTAWEIEPTEARYASRHAKSLRMAGDYEGAEAVIRTALETSPEAAELHYAMGQLRLKEGRTAEAEEALRRAIELDPGHGAAHRDLAGLLARAGHEREARRYLAVADRIKESAREKGFLLDRLGVNPGDPQLPLLLGELELTDGNHRKALQWFARVEALSGPSDRLHAARAEALFGAGQIDAGRAELSRIGEPQDGRVVLARAVEAAASGDPDEAVRLAAIAVETGPQEKDFLRRASDIYNRAGRTDEAYDLLNRATATQRKAAH
jgi:tetratricopeptide (TPR) repeat protein